MTRILKHHCILISEGIIHNIDRHIYNIRNPFRSSIRSSFTGMIKVASTQQSFNSFWQLSLLMSALSRSHEFEADQYGVLYAYRAGFLARYISWPPAALEITESLEQLRILWHGEGIHVGIAVAQPGPGVDTAEDLKRVGELIGKGC